MGKKSCQKWNDFTKLLQRAKRPLRIASRVVIIILLVLLAYGVFTLIARPTLIRDASKDSLLGSGTLVRTEEIKQFYDIAADDVLICNIGQERGETAALRVVAMDTDLSKLLVEGRSGEMYTVPFEHVTGRVDGIGIPFIGSLADVLRSWFVLIPCVVILTLSFIGGGNSPGSGRKKKKAREMREELLCDFFE